MTESTIDIAADQFEILLERIKTDSTAALHRDFYAPALSLAIPVPERNRLTAAWTARSEAANAVNHLIIEGTFTLPFVTTTLREVTTLSIPLTSLRALTAQACGWNASPDIEPSRSWVPIGFRPQDIGTGTQAPLGDLTVAKPSQRIRERWSSFDCSY